METVEELCEAIAILDRGRVVVGGNLRDVRRASGRQVVRLAVEGDPELGWLATLDGVRVTRRGQDYTEAEVAKGFDPELVLQAALTRRCKILRFRDRRPVARGDIHRAGRPDRHERTNARPQGGVRMNGWRTLLPNAWYIAVREYRSRATSRSFVIGTLILAAIAFAATQLPVLIDVAQGTSQTRVEILATAPGLPSDALTVVDQVLNGSNEAADSSSHKPYALSWLAGGDPASAQRALEAGKFDALLIIDRDPASRDLAFTLRTDMPSDGRQAQMITSATRMLAIEDGLVRAGTSTASVLAPANLKVLPVSSSGTATVHNVSQEISSTLLSTGLIVLIFMAIITYGTWVAMSVAEEKGSRVMELMLNATTPLQMLAGKVIGNGAAGLTQYGIILGAVVAGLVAQGPIHRAVLSGSATSDAFSGLNVPVLGAFVVLFVLGFLLYSLLYAALGSMVSRQEDIQKRHVAADDADHDRLLHVDLRASGDRRDVGQNRLVRPVLQPLPDARAGLGWACGDLGIRAGDRLPAGRDRDRTGRGLADLQRRRAALRPARWFASDPQSRPRLALAATPKALPARAIPGAVNPRAGAAGSGPAPVSKPGLRRGPARHAAASRRAGPRSIARARCGGRADTGF